MEFNVGWRDFERKPGFAEFIARQGGPSALLENVLATIGGTVLQKREVPIHGHTACEVSGTFSRDGSQWELVQRAVLIDYRLYSVGVSAPEGKMNPADRDKFLGSFVPDVIPKAKPDRWLAVHAVSGPFTAEYPAEPTLTVTDEIVHMLEAQTSENEYFCISFFDNLHGGLAPDGGFRSEFLDKEQDIDIVRDSIFNVLASNPAWKARILEERRDQSNSGPTRTVVIGYTNDRGEDRIKELRFFFREDRCFVLQADLIAADGKLPRQAIKDRFFKSYQAK
jgi:hypothetical protein